MASELTSSIDKIKSCIDQSQNFLLKGGAGSGKTYSLVDIVEDIYTNNKHVRIACITYTNAAVDVINSRYSNSRLEVSTIHTFLWREVKRYQRELKLAILFLTDSGKIPSRLDHAALSKVLKDGEVSYGEYLSLVNGQISHDELILIAEYLYREYPLLGRVTKSKFDFILVDEYQDTHKEVMEILFDHVQPSVGSKNLVIGLFGDEMQKIYDRGVDALNDEWKVVEVVKEDNYRSSAFIVEKVNNHLRYDSLEQEAVGINKDFDSLVHFYHSSNPAYKIESLADQLGWTDYRALYLTHRVLARNAGYESLYGLYDTPSWAMGIVSRMVREQKLKMNAELTLGDVINELVQNGVDVAAEIDGAKIELFLNDKYDQVGHLSKRLVTDLENLCPLLEFVVRIVQLKRLYDTGGVYQMLKGLAVGTSPFKVSSHGDRKRLKDVFESLPGINDNKTIGDVIAIAALYPDIFIPGDRYKERSQSAPALLTQLSSIQFGEVVKLNDTLQEDAKHGTQHSAKGKAFDNVIVVLDNGNWYQGSNYTSLFNETGYDEDTRRLIYTSCSRAIKNLAVFYLASNRDWKAATNISDAKAFFGQANITDLDV